MIFYHNNRSLETTDYKQLVVFYLEENNMAEYTGIALQTVDAGQNVVLTETPVCGSNCIQHREGVAL